MVIFQLRVTIRTRVLARITTLLTRLKMVSETTLWTPFTSLLRRDITSPVRVRVKNATDCLITRSNSWLRRSYMMLWLIRVLTYDCSTPTSPLISEDATRMPISRPMKENCPPRPVR